MLQAILAAMTGLPGISIIMIGACGTFLAAVLGQATMRTGIGAMIAGALALLSVAFIRTYYMAGGIAL